MEKEESVAEEEKKSRLASLLNELLGLDVEWERLELDDLLEIAKLFVDPEKLIERLQRAQREMRNVVESIKKTVKELVKTVLRVWQGPVIRTLRKLILEIEGEKKSDETR